MTKKTALWIINPLLFALLAMTGCASTNVSTTQGGIGIEVSHASVPGRTKSKKSNSEHFYVRVKFTNRTNFTHIVQEIEYQDGHVLVECFDTSSYVYDHHSAWGGPKKYRRRKMRVYAANVVGEKQWFGFAHLLKNKNGDMVTSIGPNFNPAYWRFAPDWMLFGRIESDDRENSSYWTLEYDPVHSTLVITLGDRD